MEWRVISIGTLPANPLWGEKGQVRTGHATTTLVVSGAKRILIDPGLPDQILAARLAERANIAPSQITHVFLTSFRSDCRRGIGAFANAEWWISEAEREGVGVPLAERLKQLNPDDEEDQVLKEVLSRDVAVLQRCRPAPDRLAERVSIFPLAGVTPGLCGVLFEDARFTVLVTGDAIPTVEHLEKGQVLAGAVDGAKARESFAEAIEVADMFVLGRDNLVVNPTKKPF
ncbi:MAG: MBL fold metallo-hydrolase [Phycisphaeraceae bacterium]|nr:MBL fold metallo-hydrolase [Phycisphaeraceae bacterium]